MATERDAEDLAPASGDSQTTMASVTPGDELAEAQTLRYEGSSESPRPLSSDVMTLTFSGEFPATSTPTFVGAPRRGDRIGENLRFEIVDKLGEGGMGHVFRATDAHLDRTVAVKFIVETHNLPLEQLIIQLEREARVTAKLNHENIVNIFDMGAFNGVPFLVMELLVGQSLDRIMETSRLSPLRATGIMLQVARGLSHAHKNGVVHRDLKPSNVFVLRDGRAKILDFGISRFERAVPANLPSDLKPTIIGAGTPLYMAPERWRDGPQDGRTDIWAAGVMFFEMLTGKLPYTVPELLSFGAAVRPRVVAPSVSDVVPSLPEEVDRIIATALNQEPEGRFQTAAELVDALKELEVLLGGSPSEIGVRANFAPSVERRPLTLLACHLEGLDDLDLDDVIEAHSRFHETCAAAVKHWGGALGTPVGGRVLGCFGYPVTQETDALRAVRAGQQIIQTLRELERSNPKTRGFDVRIAIHSGILGLPSLAASGTGLPAMLGTAPNVVRRLARRAEPMTVTISKATRDLTENYFIVQRIPSDGDAEGTDGAYRVVGEIDSASHFEGVLSERLTPLVGRESELALFHQLWQEAKDGRGQMVIVSGDAGIGKSRIVHTLRDRVTEEQNIRLTCQCRPHFKNTAFRPLVELILRSMDISREDSKEVKLTKLENHLAALGFAPEAVALFAPLLSIPFEERHRPLELPPDKRKVKTIEALVSMLLRRAVERPTLLLIEDMHWVDHSTIEFLNALMELVPTSRLFVVLTCRPEFRPPWSPRRYLHRLNLDRLPADATETMIRRAAGDRVLPDDLVARLVAVTDGVPLFVEELTDMIVESWQSDPSSSRRHGIDIPNTLHELLLAKLDRLRGLGKDVAQLCAVLGRDFHYSLIREVSNIDEISLGQGLDILTEAGLLHRQGTIPNAKYVFKHALIQQTAYQSLLKGERRLHHERTAQALLRLFPDTVSLEPELLAHHHAQAGNLQQALEYWEAAGKQASQRSALVEAIDHFKNAMGALRTLPEGPARNQKELALLLELGAPLMSVHGYAAPEVEKTYSRARELARVGGAPGDLFPAMQGLWQYYYVRGMLPASRALGEQLLEIAKDSGDSTLLLLAHRSVASSAFLQGDYEPCRFHTAEGMRLYNVEKHGALALRTGHDPGVAHGVYQAWSLWMLGYHEHATHCVMEMIELARRLSHPMTTAYALCFAALIKNHCGDHSDALRLSDDALRITGPNKFALWHAWGTMQRGWALSGMGDFAAGIPQMAEGLGGWKSTGARVGFTFFPVTLAEMCVRAGKLDMAEELVTDAKPMIDENDEHFYEPELLRIKAELVRRKGAKFDEIASYIEQGLAVARARSGKSWELKLITTRARILAESGDPSTARDELGAILEWFTEGRATSDLRAAHELLDSLKTQG